MTQRKLNPRICRGCGLVFMPTTSLQRYGLPKCKQKATARHKKYQAIAVPGREVNHP